VRFEIVMPFVEDADHWVALLHPGVLRISGSTLVVARMSPPVRPQKAHWGLKETSMPKNFLRRLYSTLQL